MSIEDKYPCKYPNEDIALQCSPEPNKHNYHRTYINEDEKCILCGGLKRTPLDNPKNFLTLPAKKYKNRWWLEYNMKCDADQLVVIWFHELDIRDKDCCGGYVVTNLGMNT
jgi:hypothetical protein